MSITIAQQKKHLLLLNRLHRNALKTELIPAPSKLLDDKVEKLFNEFFKKKDNYYVPKITSTILKIDEEEFKKLYKEPKQPKQKAMKKEEPKEEENKEEIDREKIKEFKNLLSKTKINSEGVLIPYEALESYKKLNESEEKVVLIQFPSIKDKGIKKLKEAKIDIEREIGEIENKIRLLKSSVDTEYEISKSLEKQKKRDSSISKLNDLSNKKSLLERELNEYKQKLFQTNNKIQYLNEYKLETIRDGYRFVLHHSK